MLGQLEPNEIKAGGFSQSLAIRGYLFKGRQLFFTIVVPSLVLKTSLHRAEVMQKTKGHLAGGLLS